jgi:hypothetical protein
VQVSVPGPFRLIVTSLLSVPTTVPPESSTLTAGCGLSGRFCAAPPGDGVNASCAGPPAVPMVKLVLETQGSDPSDAVRVYVPAVSTEQPLKCATPFTSATVSPLVHVNCAPPGPPVSAMVTEPVSVVTASPLMFSTVTTGCVERTFPGPAPPGSDVNASCVAMLNS